MKTMTHLTSPTMFFHCYRSWGIRISLKKGWMRRACWQAPLLPSMIIILSRTLMLIDIALDRFSNSYLLGLITRWATFNGSVYYLPYRLSYLVASEGFIQNSKMRWLTTSRRMIHSNFMTFQFVSFFQFSMSIKIENRKKKKTLKTRRKSICKVKLERTKVF